MLQLDLRTNLALVFMYIKELHLSNTQSKVNIPGQLTCRFSEKKRKEKTDVVKLFDNQLYFTATLISILVIIQYTREGYPAFLFT